MKRLAALCVAGLWVFSTSAEAHVTVKPTESPLSATQNYVVHVPTEGTSPTTSVEMAVPIGVAIVSVKGTSGSYELKRSGERVSSIFWKVEIAPGKSDTLEFVAKNPAQGTEIVFKFSQGFADGSKAAWIDEPSARRPAPVVKLVAVSK